ncbi:unnamed protein product [Lepeophtheirus salmonis]|uniref:(salmon louse) hypothetical protein n=1 Tax=Lepeophtheirus salmonis TaxID=72036 RepID=A0A7R8D035_LEPSM|nr:unnamed protein product [Lepeophtheirus salmonis]CAF2980870.1 unnamed protein product [Lepeophtheirus salmonis]
METPRKLKIAGIGCQRFTPPRLLTISHKNSGKNSLVVTGAEMSVILAYTSINTKPSFFLKTANGSSIYHSKVSQPLVGADFLRAFDLLPDLLRRRLVDTSDFISLPCKTSNISDSSHLGLWTPEHYSTYPSYTFGVLPGSGKPTPPWHASIKGNTIFKDLPKDLSSYTLSDTIP